MNTVYCIKNILNNKCYIGSTIIEPKKRFKQHIYNSTHQNTHQYNYPLYKAFRKYGIDNFKFIIIEQRECSEEEIRDIEKNYIIEYNSMSPNGYNQTLDTQHPINDIYTYRKISETKREKAKEIVEVDNNLTIIKKWRSIIDCAEETKLDERKIAAVCRGERKTTGNRKFYWIVNDKIEIPEYHRDKYKGKEGTTQIQSNSKKVAKIDINTNKIIDIYETIALAARENDCDNSAISKVCRGQRKKCGGYFWKYI